MSNYRRDDVVQIAGFFKALANPNRLRIFLRLVSCCDPGIACRGDENFRACVGELGQDLGLAPSTVSHHIRELHQAGLIRMERSGQNVDCWVPEAVLSELSKFFTDCCAGTLDDSLKLPALTSKTKEKHG
jgi:ArsR family transcriptional regulator